MWEFGLLIFVITGASTTSENFTITSLIVPPVVLTGQYEIQLGCQYKGDFTVLRWFKGTNEFFRYTPGPSPSTTSFPVLGIGQIELISCGSFECRLSLGVLTDDATGVYRCDITLDIPPYKYASKSKHMQVFGHKSFKPMVQGLVEEFGEGDEIKAYCRADTTAEIRWYINGREQLDVRGSPTFRKKSVQSFFVGIPPTMTLQCTEFHVGFLWGSNLKTARWRVPIKKDEKAHIQLSNHVKNTSNNVDLCFVLMCVTSLGLAFLI